MIFDFFKIPYEVPNNCFNAGKNIGNVFKNIDKVKLNYLWRVLYGANDVFNQTVNIFWGAKNKDAGKIGQALGEIIHQLVFSFVDPPF